VRPNRLGDAAGYPASCSSTDPTGTLRVAAPPPVAGGIGDSLRIERSGSELRLSWEPSCSTDAETYAIYEGNIGVLRTGVWDVQPTDCSSGTALAQYLPTLRGDRFFLVVPLAGETEGRLGNDSGGTPRKAPNRTCAPVVETTDVCAR
jgi:hypothetical protein